MKPKTNFGSATLLVVISVLFSISQVDGNTLAEIMECQELLKGHLNYSNRHLTPMSAQFANPFIHNLQFSHFDKANATNEPDSLADIERKEEIKVRLTMQEFHGEIEKFWKKDILPCVNVLARECAKTPMKSKIDRQAERVFSMMFFYKMITHSYAQINATEMYEKISQDKKILADIETTQIDLCAPEDIECQDCLEKKADEHYSSGFTCDSSRHWHIIKYAPIWDNHCRGMRHTRVKELAGYGYQISFY